MDFSSNHVIAFAAILFVLFLFFKRKAIFRFFELSSKYGFREVIQKMSIKNSFDEIQRNKDTPGDLAKQAKSHMKSIPFSDSRRKTEE
ncbi:MAG: hypothetical protein P8P30_04530 [Rickettsiales bacterium]|nr:hypothetical protein [Rickettsiales bacterium]